MEEEVKGYCMKCKAERPIKDVQLITTKNGRPAAQGVCPECGTKIYKFLKGSAKKTEGS